MTKILKFTGHSDDLFCVSIDDKPYEEINCYDEKATYLLQSKMDSLLIVGEYSFNGVWILGVKQISEDVPVPNWEINIIANPNCSYSPLLTITCPDDIEIVNFNDKDE